MSYQRTMVKKGDIVDLSFSVRAAIEGEKWEGPLSGLIVRPTVVSVYMRNNTGSCDKQSLQLAVVAAELEKSGIGLIGLSKDTPGSHVKYAAKHQLGFPLVSDPEHAFAQATKSLVEKKMYGKTFMGPTRSAYFIAASGEILGLVEKVDPSLHAQQIRSLVER